MQQTTLNLLSALYMVAEEVTIETLRRLRSRSGGELSRQQVHRLERNGFLSKKRAPSGDWVYGLTARGRLVAVGGRDPESAWAREWDGKWRFIIYDIPRNEDKTRKRLHRWLRQQHFGRLQGSVWITPDPLDEAKERLAEFGGSHHSIMIIDGALNAVPDGPASDIVESAWDFDGINRLYRQYLKTYGKVKRSERVSPAWLENESQQWNRAMAKDPLLPSSLLPSGYLGREAWERRQQQSAQG